MPGYRMEKAQADSKNSSSTASSGLAQDGSLERLLASVGFGLTPTAPRLSETGMAHNTYGGYPKGYGGPRGFKGTLSFAMLRQVAWRSSVLAAILSTRLHQVTRYSKAGSRARKNDVSFKVVHKRHNDPKFQVPEKFKIMAYEAERMLERPWRIYWDEGTVFKDVEPTFAGFLSKVTEDYLIINRPCVELGLDGQRIPRAFGAIDGANVIPTFKAMRWLQSRDKDLPADFQSNWRAWSRLLQTASDKYKVDLDERTEYIYMLDGKPAVGFRHDEIIVAPFAPTSDVHSTGYPKSLTERAIFILLAEIMAMSANSRYFEVGSMAESLIAIKGSYDDAHIKEIQTIFQNNMSGVPGMFRVPLLALPAADDVNVIPIKQNHKDMLFDIYVQKLTNLGCAIFRMHPSEINEAPRAGDGAGALQQASQTKQIAAATEQGLETTLLHLKSTILDPIVERIHQDLMVEFDNGLNEQEQLAIQEAYKGIATVNERRMMMGLDPLKKDDPRGEVIADPNAQQPVIAQQQQEQQEKQMKAQAGQQEDKAGADHDRAKDMAEHQSSLGGGDDQDGDQQDDGQGQDQDGGGGQPEEEDKPAPKKKKKKKAKRKGRGGIIDKTPWSDEDDAATRKLARKQ